MNLFFEIYGCEMNKSQAFSLQLFLKKNGFNIIENIEDADIIFIYTCSVRYSAEQRAYGRLHYFKYLKKQKPNLKIILLGCLAEQDWQSFIERRLVDLVVGTVNHQLVLNYLKLLNLQNSNKNVCEEKENFNNIINLYNLTSSKTSRIEFLNSYIDPSHPFRSFVTIIHGCSNFCSYCIVPYLRGKEISRKSEEIISDIKNLTKFGVKEVILLGQNVNAYGIDSNDWNFAKLLNEVSKIEGIELISFLSAHPKDFTDELIEIIAYNPKISKLVHLPLQSGSNNILQKMNRKYDINKYMSIIEKLKEKNPEIQFSTDIIVGFPDETEKDFLETLNIIQKVKYLDIFSYKYSQRKLKVLKYEDNIDENIKLERLSRLINLKEEIGYDIRREQIGKNKKAILVEDSKLDKNKKLFKTFDGFHGVFERKEKSGTIIEVKIIGLNGHTLIA